MTLVVTVNGPETIWVLTDRRLSSAGRIVKEDACKVMFLEATDGVAILGYCGLGATGKGNEPSDWMSAVLRGRNLPLEQSLGVIADAMKNQFPPHMLQIRGTGGPQHNTIVPAFLGKEVRLYSIDLAFSPDRKSAAFRYTRHVIDKSPTVRLISRMAKGGTGGHHLAQHPNNKEWNRSILGLVKAHDRGQVSALAVADRLARLNYEVHKGIEDNSVGPRCIIAWRHKKGGAHKGGGAQQAYVGTTRGDSPLIPTIGGGMAVHEIIRVMMPHMIKRLEAVRAGQPAKEPEWADDFARLSRKPDENLR